MDWMDSGPRSGGQARGPDQERGGWRRAGDGTTPVAGARLHEATDWLSGLWNPLDEESWARPAVRARITGSLLATNHIDVLFCVLYV